MSPHVGFLPLRRVDTSDLDFLTQIDRSEDRHPRPRPEDNCFVLLGRLPKRPFGKPSNTENLITKSFC